MAYKLFTNGLSGIPKANTPYYDTPAVTKPRNTLPIRKYDIICEVDDWYGFANNTGTAIRFAKKSQFTEVSRPKIDYNTIMNAFIDDILKRVETKVKK